MAQKTSGCPLPSNWEEFVVSPVKVLGPLTLQRVLLIFSLACAAVTILISIFLITKHLHRYTEPKQQRQIVRIIFTPVVFATLSALSIISYTAAKYMQPLIDLYETFALAALFLLYVEYVSPDEHTRSAFFATLENRKPKSRFRPSKGYTVVPGGSQKWYNICCFAVFMYVNIDILMTILEIVTEATDRYCEGSWNPKFAHIWYTIIVNFFLGYAITCIVAFYGRFRHEPEFAMHRPGLKLVSFKLIVFVNFVQRIIFGILITKVKTSQKMTGYDLKYGIPAAFVAFEQILFAVFFHYSFRSKEYHETMKQDLVSPRMGTFRAAANAFNPMDLLTGMFTVYKLLATRFGSGSGGNGRGAGRSGDAHLEPMSQQPLRSSSPYSVEPTGITVTGPQEIGYSNAYTGNEYGPPAYPQNTAHDGYAEADSERTGLNPYAYARTHSRDSSVDATSTRRML